jgi:hypothetical protein
MKRYWKAAGGWFAVFVAGLACYDVVFAADWQWWLRLIVGVLLAITVANAMASRFHVGMVAGMDESQKMYEEIMGVNRPGRDPERRPSELDLWND